MAEPHSRGALMRASIIVAWLSIIAAPIFSVHAEAATHHRPRANHRHDADRWLAPGAVATIIAARAQALDVPPRLAIAVARFESRLRMSMRGAAGERGAMQVLPQTANQVGIAGNLYGEAGIEAGVRYLKLAMAMHGQAGWCAVASAYNGGVWRRSRCTAYGRAVIALAARQ